MSQAQSETNTEMIARLRGELGVMADLLGQCLEVVLSVDADGCSESEMLQQLIQDTRNALAHVRRQLANQSQPGAPRHSTGATMEVIDTEQPTAASSQPPALTPPALGEYWPGQGGIYGGILPAFDGHTARHLVFSAVEAPEQLTWGPYGHVVQNAGSRTDGRSNTAAMLAEKAAASKEFPAAQWASEHSADGHTDFHLPSQAELFMALLYAPQAFGKKSWYWSSTQDGRSSAFAQGFEHGFSDWYYKGYELRVRAVRWIPLQPFSA